MRASQAAYRINKLRVINTNREIESLPLRHIDSVALTSRNLEATRTGYLILAGFSVGRY